MKQLIGYIEPNGGFTNLKTAPKLTSSFTIPKAISESEGFFGTQSMHWKIYREPGIIVAGVSALLLQIAHPAIAEGVKVYSQYQTDFLGRAHRTILSMTRIWFGSRTEAVQSAQRLYHIHAHIKGIYTRTQQGKKITYSYCANEPALLCWVLATMNMATIDGYETVYGKLSDKEKETFYQETKITAQLMGIPLSEYPSNWKTFQKYYQHILSNATLEVGETAGQISKDLFKAYFPFRWIMKTWAAFFLPKSIRKAFGLKHFPYRFKSTIGLFSGILRLIPAFLRYAPHYYQARYRLADSQNQRPCLLARWHHWVANQVRLPLFSNRLNPKL